MAVTATPVKYRASDGASFATQAEAERHDRLVTAQRQFEKAQAALDRALAESQKTADGKLFTFLHRFYYVHDHFCELPDLREVEFYRPQVEVDRDGSVILVETIHDQRRAHRISDLYWYKNAAVAAVLAAQDERIKQYQAQADELRAKAARPA